MPTRRTVLQAAIAGGAVAAFSGSLGGLRAAVAAGAVPTRKTLNGMPLNDPDLSAYRDFVRIMQGYDQSKPLSWLGYSLQHGNQDTGRYKYCPHGDWYFLPWHREYVVMYEKAVRVLTKTPNFAMPYWDWTQDRTIPAAFTDPTYDGKPNPLYVSTRTLKDPTRWPLRDSIVGPEVIKKIYSETDFQLFGTSKNPNQNDLDMRWVVAGGGVQGTLERTPHNTVHNYTGGFMPSPGSPRDPIFMMHHGNIDRIWAFWNAMGNKNTAGMDANTQRLWLEMNFKDNYLSPDGTPYSKAVKELQSTTALGYTYAGLPPASKIVYDGERAKRLLSFFASGEGVRSVENVQVLAEPNTDAATAEKPLVKRAQLRKSVRNLVMAEDQAKRTPEVYALIKHIKVPASVEAVRVFVNAANLTAATPDTDPHYVTQISFLRHDGGHGEHDEHGEKEDPSALVDLTPTLRALEKAGELKDDTISLQIIAVPRAGTDGPTEVVPAVVEIAVL